MKKIIKLFVLVLLGFIVLGLTSCDFEIVDIHSSQDSTDDEKTEEKTEDKKTEDKTDGKESTSYIIEDLSIPTYDSIDENNVGVVVSATIMQATLEITCKMEYSYSVTGWGFYGGGRSQTYTGSATSAGTAMVINEEGYILTNAHVINMENASSYSNFQYTSRAITVNYVGSETTFDAEIVTYDEDLDIAILKMDASKIDNLKYVTFFDMTDPRTEDYNKEDAVKLYYGETVYAIGNANGYGISVTSGVVSAPVRVFTSNGESTYAIQTDAAINSGNSGGPLSNAYAAVIGMNSFKIVSSSTSEGLGYAIPTYVILEYIDSYNDTATTQVKYYTTTTRAYTK